MAKLNPIFSSLAKSLIDQFGRKASLQKATKSHYDPLTGESKSIVKKEIMIFQDVYESKDFRYSQTQGTGNNTKNHQIQLGDIPIYTYEEINKNDLLVFDDTQYVVIHQDKYVCEDKTVLYGAVIRGN